MIPEKQTIKQYETTIDWHLNKLKTAIMSHYKDVNLNQYNFVIMDKADIDNIIENLYKIMAHCKEPT